MENVWVVWIDQSYANYVGEPEAVFTSREKAEAYCGTVSHAGDFRIEEVPVDPTSRG